MLDMIAGRGAAAAAATPADPKAAGKKPDDKKDAGKKKSVKTNAKARADAAAKDIKAPSVTTISLVSPIERVEVPLDEAVHLAIAREHQILHYRLEMIGWSDFPSSKVVHHSVRKLFVNLDAYIHMVLMLFCRDSFPN